MEELTWPIVDLRVDWAEHDPVEQLASLWAHYRPQLQNYILRALEPGKAPA